MGEHSKGKRQARIAGAWIRERFKSVLIYGVIVVILYSIAGLYSYTGVMKNMAYGVLLIVFFGFCFWVWDFVRYRSKCMRLLDIAGKEQERDRNLPEPKGLPEELYQEMICALEAEKQQILSEYDEKKQDMADYYTMWIHQIKTPIAAMRLLLKEGDPAGRELFKIEEYAEMALHYARLESFSSDLLFRRQDVCGMVKQAVKKYSLLFIGSGLSFTMEEFSCEAVTDEKWLVFVFGQILSNALKYTKSGGIRISGRDRRGKETKGQAASVVIEDSGIGIRREDLPRVFERGFTGCNGRLDERSTGIGLYLCRQIMDRLSHTIEVESEAGKGTRVILGFIQEPM